MPFGLNLNIFFGLRKILPIYFFLPFWLIFSVHYTFLVFYLTYERKHKWLLKDSSEEKLNLIKCYKYSNFGCMALGHWSNCYTEWQAIISKLSLFKLIYILNIGTECLKIIHWHYNPNLHIFTRKIVQLPLLPEFPPIGT